MLKYWLWLTNLRGLSNQTRLALLRHFGTPEDIYYADEGENCGKVHGLQHIGKEVAALNSRQRENPGGNGSTDV